MAEINIVTHADIQRCPKKSLSAEHYRMDGSCLCSDTPERKARIADLRKQRAQILDEIHDLERGL